jgi:hypothetical protein
MKTSALNRQHAELRPKELQTWRDLFEGGHGMRERIARYLPQHEVEPGEVYKRRCATAHYVNYLAPLVNLFASWLFTCEPELKPAGGVEAPPVYAEVEGDADGLGTDFDVFLRGRLADAMVDRTAYWQVVFPEPDAAPQTLGEYEGAGLGRPTLRPMPRASVVHWRRDDKGELLWLVEHTHACELIDWTDTDETVTETWTLWSADGQHRRWQAVYAKGATRTADEDVQEVTPPYDPTGTLPIVELRLPPELHLVGQLASGQLEIFRKRCALSWGMDRTCYAMPVFFTADSKPIPTMGAGYYLQLGKDDRVEWPAPSSVPFDVIKGYVDTLKDELHRVATAMKQGVDNSAASMGRSGESKNADASDTEKVLRALGKLVELAAEKTFDLIAIGRGDVQDGVMLSWTAGGMDVYDEDDLAALLENVVAAQALKIPSATLEREMLLRVGLALLGKTDEKTVADVRAEILAPRAEVAKSPTDVLIGDYDVGSLTVNEIRKRKGEEPIAGGDVTTIVWKAQQDALAAKILAGTAAPETTTTAPSGAAQPPSAQPVRGAAPEAARTSA